MNVAQRELITDFFKQLLKNESSGDFVSSHNSAKQLIYELQPTDKILNTEIKEIINDFEND